MIVVIATDAPLSDRNLRRLASRAMMGLGRTGSSASNGSGDYAIAFSTASEVRRTFGAERLRTEELANDQASAVFQGGVDAVEEAVYLADRVIVLARDPGRLREIVDVRAIRQAERWSERPIDEVMDLASFTHLRTHVWRLLRDQIRPDD